MKKDNNFKKRIDFIFFIFVFFISFVPLSYLISFLPFVITGGKVVIVFMFGSLFYFGIYSNKEDILSLFLSEELLEKMNIRIIEWKSREFDEFVGRDLIDLRNDSRSLFVNYKMKQQMPLSDYSFLVLPIAKVYEGILKKILVEVEIIREDELLKNPSLNVGMYFNPQGNKNIYNYIKDKRRDKVVPHTLYSTYQECRNNIFHYDQHRDNKVKSIKQAKFYIDRIEDAIEKAYDTFKK